LSERFPKRAGVQRGSGRSYQVKKTYKSLSHEKKKTMEGREKRKKIPGEISLRKMGGKRRFGGREKHVLHAGKRAGGGNRRRIGEGRVSQLS